MQDEANLSGNNLESGNDKPLFRPRKRLCKPNLHKRAIRKENVERGKGKVFQIQAICKCSKNCPTKIDANRQKEIFDTFYQKSNWTQKTLLIRSSIKTSPVLKKKSELFPILSLKKRELNYNYSLIDNTGITQAVCRDFFMKCLQVTPTRIYNAVRTASKNPSANEKRGKAPSKNKTTELEKEHIRNFIDSIPKYESHYGRERSDRKYLSSNLNIITLYREYCKVLEFKDLKPVKENIFRNIFNTEYNLSFKRRHTDTCKTCDELNVKFQSKVLMEATRKKIEEEKFNHLSLVNRTNETFRTDVEMASKSNGQIAVLTFDLQKTLETPSLTTSVAFYKRQLWTYNLCIYDEVQKKGKCHLFLFLLKSFLKQSLIF